jgi:membrane protein
LKKQTQYLNILLAAMIVWVPNQLHLPADLGVKGLNSINLLFLALIYYVHQRNKKLPPSEATPLKGVFIAYFCMLIWGFLAGQLSDRSLMMEDLTAMKNSIFFMCLYFVFFHGARDETSVRHLFYVVLFVAAVAGIEAIREGIDYGFGVYGETKRAAGPFGSNYKASNLAAVFFSMFMPVFAAVALYQKGRPTVRMGAIAGVVILLLGIFCTYSRQAYLIVAAMLLLMTLKRNVVLGILILVAVVNYQAWVPEGVVTRLAMTEQTSEETGEEQLDESTESRFILWAGAGRLLMSRPWGIGLNHFKREIGSEEPSLAGLDAHNFLVLITTEAGPFGGIMTLILYASLSTLAWRFWKLARTPDQQAMAAGFAGATIAVMLGNLYGSRLLDGAVTGNYWILAGLSARYWLLLKNGTRDETGALIDTTQASTTPDGKGPDDKPRPPIQWPATRPDRPSPRDADGRLIRPAG